MKWTSTNIRNIIGFKNRGFKTVIAHASTEIIVRRSLCTIFDEVIG